LVSSTKELLEAFWTTKAVLEVPLRLRMVPVLVPFCRFSMPEAIALLELVKVYKELAAVTAAEEVSVEFLARKVPPAAAEPDPTIRQTLEPESYMNSMAEPGAIVTLPPVPVMMRLAAVSSLVVSLLLIVLVLALALINVRWNPSRPLAIPAIVSALAPLSRTRLASVKLISAWIPTEV